MNNKEFISELSQHTALSQSDTKKRVFTVLDNLLTKVSCENTLHVPSFGTFEVKKRLERCIINPNNGHKMLIPPKLVISFRPTSSLKEQLQKGGGTDDE